MPQYTTTNIRDEVDLRLSSVNEAFPPTTLSAMFLGTVTKFGSQDSLHYKKDGV
ncbi:hypothetical protein ACHHYP_20285, partial [Achlya hypogyna]